MDPEQTARDLIQIFRAVEPYARFATYVLFGFFAAFVMAGIPPMVAMWMAFLILLGISAFFFVATHMFGVEISSDGERVEPRPETERTPISIATLLKGNPWFFISLATFALLLIIMTTLIRSLVV